MGRQTLRITIVLGMLVTLLGGTGIFATFSDRATAGDNSVTTGERPRAAELKIGLPAAPDEFGQPAPGPMCAPATTQWSDDTTTAQFNSGSIQPGAHLQDAYLCLLNAGSASLVITASAIDLVDTDVDCTGDEAAAGDTSCGTPTGQPAQPGELSPLLQIQIDRVDCLDPANTLGLGVAAALDDYTVQPLRMDGTPTPGPLAPQGIACLRVKASYPTPSETQAQIAQTDRVTWKFAFDAAAQ